jgi:imidazole glycerol-phosphate synthase subunit HisF
MFSKDYDVWTHNATKNTKRNAVEAALEFEALGAGEIVINAIDNDGHMKGYDLALARRMREALHIPMSVLGGAGSMADIGALFGACGVVGAAAGSLFVFKGTFRAVLINYPPASQKDELIRATLVPARR